MNNMNLIPVYPEIFLLIATSAILLIDMFLPDAKRVITYLLSLLALVVCAVLTFTSYSSGETVYTFSNMFVSDPLSSLLKLFSYLAIGLTLIYGRQYSNDRSIVGGGHLGGEFYVLALFSLLGQMVMISGNSFLSIYLGLELMSLSLYALVALRRDNVGSTEAAMKYFVLGALASGFLLYGISMLYGATGSLELNDVFRAIVSGTVDRNVLVFGIVFVVAGLAFKLGAVPFHMWVPDVYHGAPTPVTLLIGGAPKLAAFAMVFRLLVEGLLPLAIDWQQMLMVLAVLSIIIGNVTAIAQTNIKRMLAYSTISHMGFMLLGMMSGVVDGNLFQAVNAYSSSLFYAITYVLTTLGTFGVILLMTRSGFEADTLDDFKGLNQRSPWFAGVMLVLMFSLAGIPPMVGFYAKLSVLQAVLGTGQIWLAVLAVVFSLVGAFYYLRVIKNMYFDEPADSGKITASFDVRVALSLNGLAALAIGLWPGHLMDACTNAIVTTLATFLSKVIAT
ncbi:NADH-quinone oxidoreductase subunit NuoN [Herbaspirillum sp. RV1423]|uniref:NADH-quinone oxidoreductase subunit NuoN n=1 Tax=Herbaspirillum sp. RV1423 TaxID=1443993 RepID=UPI0004B636A4|nr:NADH-quinone oxidoreductase subunit NuoN [Herbaspirillum sp. RV1423]